MVLAAEPKVVWTAQPGPQTDLISCPVFEVFFGGARGGGKTEGSIGDWLEHSQAYGEGATGVFFRREAKQLDEVIARTRMIFTPLGAQFRAGNQNEWTMPNGARLKFRHLERDSDAEAYQGHSYTRVYIEEVTNFPMPNPINLLRATLRSPVGVPVGMRLTGNPGGPGHNWVKRRYIDPAPGGYKIITETFKNPFTGEELPMERVFIPSKISDNPLLMRNDPLYIARLQQAGSEQLVKAWLTGDWDVVLGAFFDCWDAFRHVLPLEWLEKIPKGAMRFRAFDWGSEKPFSVGWYVVSDGTWGLPKGALVKYREWYGASGPNIGLKLFAGQVAEGIKEREKGETISYGVADPACFIRDGGPSIAEEMLIKGVVWQRADNKRITGWDQLRKRLVGEKRVLDDGRELNEPMLYFLECCEDSIRTIPTLQHDETHPEDVDTDGEDHAGDETRYAVMSRPWVPRPLPDAGAIVLPKLPGEMTINEIIAKRASRRRAAAAERI